MDKTLIKLEAIFSEMVRNDSTLEDSWKNIELGHKAFELMLSLPDKYPGEYETPADKAHLLSQMLNQMNETQSPRFCITVREEIGRLNPKDSANDKALHMLHDYIDTSITMEDFCKRYGWHLKFDPIERSEEYERVIADVEREIAEELKDIPHGMGFCFEYWSAKKAGLAQRAIKWNSPRDMNPRVLFD